MSDWQAGDLALCVNDDIGTVTAKCLERGKIYKVVALDIDPDFADIGLHLAGIARPWPDHWQREIGWSETRFVKITPGHTITGSEVDQREPWKVGV